MNLNSDNQKKKKVDGKENSLRKANGVGGVFGIRFTKTTRIPKFHNYLSMQFFYTDLV